MKADNVKVTTTSGFEGVEIVEYFEPITAHVVVGMNLFKDFFAGLTDIFGGKSNTYQNTLASINEDVIDQLRRKANAIGANCILGLKIDNDEISSQNKSMLMVTAVGTAAKANFPQKAKNTFSASVVDVIDFDKFDFLRRKREYLSKIDDNSFSIDDEFIEFAIFNRVPEFADFFISALSQSSPSSIRIIEYFGLLDHDYAIDKLYNVLKDENIKFIKPKVVAILADLQLVDFKRIIDIIKVGSFETQKTTLQLLKYDKSSFDHTDIESIKTLLVVIESYLQERGTVITKKKALLSKEKDVWQCECGKENEIEIYFCSNCSKDTYGFYEREFNPSEAIEKLKVTLCILLTSLK